MDYAGAFADLTYYDEGINTKSDSVEFNLNGQLTKTSYDINKHLPVSHNLNNVFNQKYLYSVSQGSGYYASPINGSLAINWKY